MTQPCDFADLDCPEPDNYAAIAKQLHETALEAEQRIFCLEHELRSAVNHPTFVATTTANTFAVSDTDGFDLVITAGLVFVGTDGTPVVDFQNSSFNYFDSRVIPAGIWHWGVSMDPFATGVVTSNSYRMILANVTKVVGGVSQITETMMRSTTQNATGAGGDMTLSAVTRFDGASTLLIAFKHGNTGSTMTIVPGARIWFTRLSDADVLRTV